VVYVTSIKAVRETSENCKRILHTLKARHIEFTVKDVNLHPDYSKELRERLQGNTFTLPQASQVSLQLRRAHVNASGAKQVCFRHIDLFLYTNTFTIRNTESGKNGDVSADLSLYGALLQVFVAGNLVGDGERVLEMNETGELEELLQDYKVEVLGNFGAYPV